MLPNLSPATRGPSVVADFRAGFLACDPRPVSDNAASPRPEAPVPISACVAGLALAVSSAFPWAPDGRSFLALLSEEFSRGALEGLLMMLGFGSPFLFGLGVSILPRTVPYPIARRILRLPLAFMHSQLVLVAIVLWLGDAAVASLPLLGFALVSGVLLAVHTARAHAEGDGPQVGWYVRWGGMIVAGICAWMELQRAADIYFGLGLHVALVAGVLMAVSLVGRSIGAAAPAQAQVRRPSTLL